MKKILIFKKRREVGEIISDTFAFIRLEGQNLLKYIVRFAGIPLVLVIITASIYSINNDPEYNPIPQDTFNFINLFILLISALVYSALCYSITLNYIQSYINNQGQVHDADIRAGIKRNFMKIIGLILLTGIIMVVVVLISSFITGILGFLLGNLFWLVLLFFFVPIVYFFVVFSITYPISVFEGLPNSSVINQSFKLISSQWWVTFLALLVIGLIYIALIMVFNIPAFIYLFIQEFVSTQEYVYYEEAQIDWVELILNTFGVIAQYVLLSIQIIAGAFIYFNLNERKNFTGTLESIETIGHRES